MLHIVLLEPEIPMNTGNIGRTCAATGVRLHLIRPLGFELTDKMIKRSGLDYWDRLDYRVYDDVPGFLEETHPKELWMATTKARRSYTEVTYSPDAYLMFGKESAGIPEELLVQNEAHCVRIPMGHGIRSLNLSNSAAIILYEALRQNAFPNLEEQGALHRLHWD